MVVDGHLGLFWYGSLVSGSLNDTGSGQMCENREFCEFLGKMVACT